MWWKYLIVFAASFGVDLIPVIGPPVWIVMVFLQIEFHLNIWLVLAFGVPASALGRYVMSLYIPRLSNKIIKRHKNEEMQFLGEKLGQNHWKSWVFVFLYTLTPLSTTALFTAAGMARIKPLRIVPPFFIGKFISDMIMVMTGAHLASSAGQILQGTFSWKGILTMVFGLVVLAALLFIDWRVLLQEKKIRFNFKIWK